MSPADSTPKNASGPSDASGAKEEKKISPELAKQFRTRINHVRLGQEASQRGDYVGAIRAYHHYLNIVAQVCDTSPYDLTPGHFNKDEQISEMLLVSQVFWDLAKIFDLSSKSTAEFNDALNRFVLFSVNAPYQVANAETMRKFLRRNKFKHKAEFERAYRQIHVVSKRCYVATYGLGETHPLTQSLREFKTVLLRYPGGLSAVAWYYRWSPLLVSWCERSGYRGTLLTVCVLRPLVVLAARSYRACRMIF